MKNALKVIVAAAVLAALVWIAHRLTRSEPGGGTERQAYSESVRVVPVTKGVIERQVSVMGEVQAIAQVELAPKVTGRLMELRADEGATVKKGELVAVLDKDVFQAQVDQAMAAVAVAQANLKNAEIRRENAERDYRRVKSLFEQGTSPQAALDDAEAAYKVAASIVDVASANESQARAALELAQIQLREASLYAPFDAVVSKKLLDVGAYVSAGNPVLTLVSVDTVKVTAGVSEEYIGDVEVGKTSVTVTVDALKGRKFGGSLYRVSPTLDPSTRTAEIDVRIANGDHLLKPGMYARIVLVTNEKKDVLLVPNDALMGREGAYYVYAVVDDRVKRTPVETGIRSSAQVELTSGLSEGARVVVSGEGNLLDGARVQVRGEDAPLEGGGADAPSEAPGAQPASEESGVSEGAGL